MFWLQLLAAIKYNDRLILRQFCLSGIESIQNIVSAEKKKWERENRVPHKKKWEKQRKKKRLMTLELKKHTLMMTRVVAHKYVDQRSWKTGILERYLPGDSMATTAVSTAANRRAAPGASGLAAVLQGPVQCSRSTWGRMRCSQSHVRGGTCLDRTCWERVSRLLNGVSRRNSPIGQLQPALPEARRFHGRRARRKLSVLLSQFTYSQLAPRPPGL